MTSKGRLIFFSDNPVVVTREKGKLELATKNLKKFFKNNFLVSVGHLIMIYI